MNKYEIYQVGDGYLIQIDTEFTDYSFYDVPKQIIDIIKHLEQENKELKRNCNIGNENLSFYIQENKELHNKIDNAIKYINKNSIYFATSEKVGNYFSNCNCDDLLEILKDSDVDE